MKVSPGFFLLEASLDSIKQLYRADVLDPHHFQALSGSHPEGFRVVGNLPWI
jgi:hypothetical protein